MGSGSWVFFGKKESIVPSIDDIRGGIVGSAACLQNAFSWLRIVCTPTDANQRLEFRLMQEELLGAIAVTEAICYSKIPLNRGVSLDPQGAFKKRDPWTIARARRAFAESYDGLLQHYKACRREGKREDELWMVQNALGSLWHLEQVCMHIQDRLYQESRRTRTAIKSAA